MTDADQRALKHMPDEGWFSIHDLPHQIRCPYFRCELLEKQGVLESRVIKRTAGDESGGLLRQWRKLTIDANA